jgi:predicted ATPase/class 3 adenylate cyclase
LNRVVATDVLVEHLWGDAPPPTVGSTLQSLVSRLRRTIEGGGPAAGGGGPRLRGRDGGYVLEAAPDRVDAVRFDRLLAEGRQALGRHDGDTATARLAEALDLWRGPAFGELADRPFARLEAQRLEEARLAAVEDLADALLAVGRAEEALERLKPHVAEHPLRERAWGQTMLALYRLGRQAEALRAYQGLRHTLAEELGVDPSPELRRLEEQILRQTPELASPGGPVRPAGEPRWSGDIVVFLFTDIEGSTRRWEADREAMAADLARHDALVLDVAASHGGEVFSHTGDGFCVGFPTVRAAFDTAVGIQRRLRDEPWSSSEPVRVRMAVHAGPAQRRAGNWFGPTLNRTARLLATAAGGQIVCSQVAADLGGDDLAPLVGLTDLGEHRLADLTRRERIYQLTHPDLPADFRPLRSLDDRRHNLPVALTSFVGRERELNEVVALLSTCRLLTLAGTGGAGKTRLALQAAANALDRYPDGVWFVELAPVRDPDLVANEVATSLGLLPSALLEGGRSLEDGLCRHLRTRRLLLVLDNCEHVVESAARLAHAVLRTGPDMAVLATSREVLGVPGEVVWTVPPLSMPPQESAGLDELAASDAVMLFCERARTVQPGFGLSDGNAAAVARICRRLDGIPLGLELAAAKIRMLGAQEVAERLDDRFRLLTGGSRTAVPRHQTLRAAMDWGYALLPLPEQVVLRRLAVFRGTFTLEAVEAVVGSVPPEPASGVSFEVLDLLARLVDKSMVVIAGDEAPVRYRLLETVREYAQQQLADAGEAEDVATRHRDFFLGLADEWAERTKYWEWWLWIGRITADQDNFAGALDWSRANGDHEALLRLVAAHWPHWYWGEAVGWEQWLPGAVDRCRTPSPARVEALIALAYLRLRSGDGGERTWALFNEAREVATGLGIDQVVAQVNFYEAHSLFALGETGRAGELLRDAVGRSTSTDFIGWCHWALGWAAVLADDVGAAAGEFRTSLMLGEEANDESLRAHVRPALALVDALRGDGETARAVAAQGVASAERVVGAPRVLMMALALAGQVAVLTGDDAGATALDARLLRILHDKGVTYWADEGLAIAALVLADRSPEDAAVVLNSRPTLRAALDDTGTLIGPLRIRLRQCRDRLVERLGAGPWQAAERNALGLPAQEAIARALSALVAGG